LHLHQVLSPNINYTMLFLGIYFVTSGISAFFAWNQIAVSNIYQQTPTAKLASNLGRTATKTQFLFVQPQRPVTLNATLLPSRFLNIDLGNKRVEHAKTPVTSQSRTQVKTSNNPFCTSAGSENESSKVASKELNVVKTSVSSAPQLLNSNDNENDFTNKILRSIRSGLPPTLRNLFRLPISFESKEHSSSLSVTTIRRDETNYEVWLNNRLIANLPSFVQASLMQQRLNKLLQSETFLASQLRPAQVDGAPAIMVGNRFLFAVSKEISSNTTRSSDLIAIDWVNNLRSALKAPELSLTEGQQDMYGLQYSGQKLSGLASWYGGYFHGRTTANGETYNQNDLTVAHKTLPFNTYLEVTNKKTGKSVIVRVNDRGPYIPPRSLDLSLAAARCVGSETAGVVDYEAFIMRPSQPKMTLNARLAERDRKRPQQLAVVSEL
jgi:rare lipoprotein A